MLYANDPEHHRNAVLRLLGLSEEEFEAWISSAQEAEGDSLERLKSGWQTIRPMIPPPYASQLSEEKLSPEVSGPNGQVGRLWIPAIAEDSSVGFSISAAFDLAWLVEWDGNSWRPVLEPPEYEEAYFEGSRSAGGYTEYRSEASWRMEKARRQVEEITRISPSFEGPVLDVGSGYGYFRQALTEAGLENYGVEVSSFARSVAREEFGQDTLSGTLDDHVDEWREEFSLVTAFDVIEHVLDYEAFLSNIYDILKFGGLCCIKTPNIDCPEAYLFNEYYHSLKREHLILFTPQSLGGAASATGFETVRIDTVSHLLQGFVGHETCERWARSGRGADIVAWFRRPIPI